MSPACSASADDFSPLLARGEAGPSEKVAPDPDLALMLEVAGDSAAAFTALVHRYQNPLVNFFARMGASSDCEDLVQETFVRLYNYRRRYRPAARFTTFLYHLARHVWADRGRKIVRLERLATEFQIEAEIASQRAPERPAEAMDAEAALTRLSPKLREVLVLNIYQGLRYQEIADVLEIPLGTVKSRINLALSAMKEVLRES
jgi:RNA polymerase sigma-70 factor (ECF subfamily)